MFHPAQLVLQTLVCTLPTQSAPSMHLLAVAMHLVAHVDTNMGCMIECAHL